MLLKNIQEIANEPMALVPTDRRAEYDNTHWLGATAEERSALSTEQVVSALLETARTLQHQVRAASYDGPATFYVWHDKQAGQLRCSTSSLPPTDLPFSGAYQPTDELDGIVASFLTEQTPGFIPWEDVKPVDDTDPDSDDHRPFPVWAFDLGANR